MGNRPGGGRYPAPESRLKCAIGEFYIFNNQYSEAIHDEDGLGTMSDLHYQFKQKHIKKGNKTIVKTCYPLSYTLSMSYEQMLHSLQQILEAIGPIVLCFSLSYATELSRPVHLLYINPIKT